jgi:glycosyltransferase involved in cell wall biosynthesis
VQTPAARSHMAKVSIILPTFNRADTIARAIRSVQAQTYQDWELIVVDDGSSDDTAAIIAGMDPRMAVIRQANRGFTEARNAGIRAGRGEYFAFLDSDDEFLPHHLQLCVAFLDTFKEEHVVSTELLEDFGNGHRVNHYRTEVSDWYPRKAALIGSHRLDLPAGETDDYLRVYESREPIGTWGRSIAAPLDADQRAYVYRGRIFEYLRYDFLITITATVMRSTVFETLGLPDTRWRSGSDFHFMASLCRAFQANYISLPTFLKHEFAADGELPANGHVVTGKTALAFIEDWQAAWDDLFWNTRSGDSEVAALRCLRHFWMAQMALRAGDRRLTLRYLREARQGLPGFARPIALELLVRSIPSVRLAQRIWRAAEIVADRYQRYVARRIRSRASGLRGSLIKP